jgi:hypothetical protein
MYLQLQMFTRQTLAADTAVPDFSGAAAASMAIIARFDRIANKKSNKNPQKTAFFNEHLPSRTILR